MLPKGQDWAALCRDYRIRRGLKQEAMAQDFNVDQSTVSRWERGIRVPSLPVKQVILNDLAQSGRGRPDDALQLLLEMSGSAVGLWDRRGILRGCSDRFARELARAGMGQMLHRPAREILGGSDLMERALALLEEHGFFEGQIPMASLTFTPVLDTARRAAGGLTTASVLPFELPDGEIAMLSIYDHDVFAEPPEDPDQVTVFWVDVRQRQRGHAWFSGWAHA